MYTSCRANNCHRHGYDSTEGGLDQSWPRVHNKGTRRSSRSCSGQPTTSGGDRSKPLVKTIETRVEHGEAGCDDLKKGGGRSGGEELVGRRESPLNRAGR